MVREGELPFSGIFQTQLRWLIADIVNNVFRFFLPGPPRDWRARRLRPADGGPRADTASRRPRLHGPVRGGGKHGVVHDNELLPLRRPACRFNVHAGDVHPCHSLHPGNLRVLLQVPLL